MTAKIKLNAASGGGSFSLQAPSSSSNNRVFTLPDLADATLLTSNATLGKFASYAIICDRKSNGVNGQNLVSGGWRVRDLNHEIADADGIVSISSNRFTLQAGTYLIKANAPQYGRGYSQIRLYNYTDSSTFADGQSNFANYGDNIYNSAFVWGRTTISGAKEFEVLHRCSEGSGTAGGGVGAGGGFTVYYEIYTVVEIYKEA